MLELTLQRYEELNTGTFGRLNTPTITLETLELPWRENKKKISRILAGIYQCRPYTSKKFRDVYELINVPGREKILIHTGNLAGDKALGFQSHVEGCILVGMRRGDTNGQPAVVESKKAMAQLRALIGKSCFTLTIKDIG